MNKKIIGILKKVYYHENGFYNSELDRHEHKIPDSVTKEDLKLLVENGLTPNNFETFEHSSSLQRLLKLKENPKLTLDFAKAMFLKGLTGEFPRGRQTLMSFIYIKNLYEHKFEGKENCEISGLPKNRTIDKTHQLYTYYLGHSWNEIPIHNLIELEEILKYEEPKVTAEDKDKLIELLALISQSDPNETPGKLEKRIAKNKVLPRTDKYKRYGILLTLSECGILPNDFILPTYDKFSTRKEIWKASENLTTSHRSDIVLPFGGWKGKNGVNYERYKEIFE
ncbi:hypothetical protein [uncultured Aquimarina sp.]|uniref:hypothetical protein n=1 Tax=uncultured Aquimarina sp. TaxID=575652 RepID=UPI00262CE1C0|nr:hypothetical protein [uncultured Aquimarina sp.]